MRLKALVCIPLLALGLAGLAVLGEQKQSVGERMAVAAEKFVLGLPNSNQLNRLNASMRASTDFVPPTLKVRESPASTFLNPGPRTRLRCMLPNVPMAGCANAFGSRKRMPPFAGLID